jgi:hypothetical protein
MNSFTEKNLFSAKGMLKNSFLISLPMLNELTKRVSCLRLSIEPPAFINLIFFLWYWVISCTWPCSTIFIPKFLNRLIRLFFLRSFIVCLSIAFQSALESSSSVEYLLMRDYNLMFIFKFIFDEQAFE